MGAIMGSNTAQQERKLAKIKSQICKRCGNKLKNVLVVKVKGGRHFKRFCCDE